jgi:hypothetical protein
MNIHSGVIGRATAQSGLTFFSTNKKVDSNVLSRLHVLIYEATYVVSAKLSLFPSSKRQLHGYHRWRTPASLCPRPVGLQGTGGDGVGFQCGMDNQCDQSVVVLRQSKRNHVQCGFNMRATVGITGRWTSRCVFCVVAVVIPRVASGARRAR